MLRDLFLEITNKCNLRCTHCYHKQFTDNCISLVKIKQLVNKAKNIILTGGEPILHPQINEILKYIKEQNKKIILISNGVILPNFEDLIIKYVDVLNISLEYPDQRHNYNRNYRNLFNIVCKNCELLHDKTKINLLITLFKENLNEIENFVKLAERLKVNICFDRYVQYKNTPRMPDPEDYKKALELIHKLKKKSKIQILVYEPLYYTLYPEEGQSRHRCKQRLYINNSLQNSPCPFYPQDYKTEKQAINERIGEALPKECENCDHKLTCHGGCPATRLIVCGSTRSKDPLCWR